MGEPFDRLWSQALLAMSTAEEEASKMVQKVAEVAGWSQDEVRRQVRDATEKLQAQRKVLETAVEDGVRKALSGLKVPRRDDLIAFEKRLDAAAERMDRLTGADKP